MKEGLKAKTGETVWMVNMITVNGSWPSQWN